MVHKTSAARSTDAAGRYAHAAAGTGQNASCAAWRATAGTARRASDFGNSGNNFTRMKIYEKLLCVVIVCAIAFWTITFVWLVLPGMKK